MAKKTRVRPTAGISLADLVYAVGQLVESGRTTPEEIAVLASQRGQRIRNLEAELTALRRGLLPAGDLAAKRPAAARPRPTREAKAAPKAKPSKRPPSKKAVARTATPARKPSGGRKPARKVGQVITRKDGRKFTNTRKVVAARRLQGQYIGNLRKVKPTEQGAFKAIAREQGVSVALEAIKKHLGT
jgi:hypothetical protein